MVDKDKDGISFHITKPLKMPETVIAKFRCYGGAEVSIRNVKWMVVSKLTSFSVPINSVFEKILVATRDEWKDFKIDVT